MRSRISYGVVMMLGAIVLSLAPAVGMTVQSAAALSTCDRAQFIADVTVPDGSYMAAGATFNKVWRVKNIGTCSWSSSYSLTFSSGNQLGGASSTNLPNSVAPGQTIDLSVGLTAPGTAGHYVGYWTLKNQAGAAFGIGAYANKPWWVEINVSGSGTTGNVAYDFAANYCSANWTSMQGNLPCPGTDGDTRGSVAKVDAPQLEDGTTASGAGILMAPQSAYNGDVHGAFPAFHVQAGDRFESVVNCAYAASSCYVTFRLDYQIGNGPIYTAWSFREKYEGLYYHVNLDLSRLAGHDVKFILTVLASGSATGDRALWSNPVITRGGTGTAPTVTPRPGATSTPIPASACDRAQFVADITIPDGTAYAAGTEFDKIWRLKNVGRCTWTTSYAMVYDSGERMSAPDAVPMPMNVAPGSTVDIAVHLRAPSTSGSYRGYWMFQNASGARFGLGAAGTRSWWVEIAVFGTSASLTPTIQSVTVTPPTVITPTVITSTPITSTPSTPTPTPPTPVSMTPPTPPGSACDQVDLLGYLVEDGTVFAPGETFYQMWRIQNIGTCAWTGSYWLAFIDGDRMGADYSYPLTNGWTISPGQVVDIHLLLTAPSTPGTYEGYWALENPSGKYFGWGPDGDYPFWINIQVAEPTATPAEPSPTPTQPSATPSETPTSGPTVTPSPIEG